ncbi:hypothetical protein [Burkholderia gladioli]|uniref:hypothetical protein n=1 Tax=Burkholderia gladioli TaxID=28095 RepID=UPI0016408062|nr:hypothetical protein [Burkholderia gladioli]
MSNRHSSARADSSAAEKPDYQDAAFRGALMRDPWSVDSVGCMSTIPSNLIGDVSRAADALCTIGRLMHNSLCEPDATGAEPLGLSGHLGLASAAELIGKHLANVADHMCEQAHGYAAWKNEQEKDHA